MITIVANHTVNKGSGNLLVPVRPFSPHFFANSKTKTYLRVIKIK
jgi:hypothetical protein